MSNSYEANPYYHPEAYGLEVVGELDLDESYEFDILWVVRHAESGKLYWCYDSGCSCPSPFEDEKFPEDFKELTTVAEFNRAVAECYQYRQPGTGDVMALQAKIEAALMEAKS